MKNHQLYSISLQDIKKALEDKKRPNLLILLSAEYYNFLNIFSQTKSDKLPSHRSYNYDILLMPDIEPPAQALRNHSQDEL